ncbi:hypothetical protein QR680_000922 [Steinernema hermaphroditum]|uniref:Uncharacterized protein n=1 Tax=Steinernema hermaphroditum TaxID=289476 RepID=A0AA39GWC7_9BILA|nr:hypothetical protein QR680_000922 [Steinernema hermaphroditum]
MMKSNSSSCLWAARRAEAGFGTKKRLLLLLLQKQKSAQDARKLSDDAQSAKAGAVRSQQLGFDIAEPE